MMRKAASTNAASRQPFFFHPSSMPLSPSPRITPQKIHTATGTTQAKTTLGTPSNNTAGEKGRGIRWDAVEIKNRLRKFHAISTAARIASITAPEASRRIRTTTPDRE